MQQQKFYSRTQKEGKRKMNRTSPEQITDLAPNEVFVFGSNTAGRHGAGAAKQALRWGAKYGVGEGLQGQTYALPTVNASVTAKLPIDEVQLYVDNFVAFAKRHPELTFLVTAIGTGLAGYSIEEMAPLFIGGMRVQNILLPQVFWEVIGQRLAHELVTEKAIQPPVPSKTMDEILSEIYASKAE